MGWRSSQPNTWDKTTKRLNLHPLLWLRDVIQSRKRVEVSYGFHSLKSQPAPSQSPIIAHPYAVSRPSKRTVFPLQARTGSRFRETRTKYSTYVVLVISTCINLSLSLTAQRTTVKLGTDSYPTDACRSGLSGGRRRRRTPCRWYRVWPPRRSRAAQEGSPVNAVCLVTASQAHSDLFLQMHGWWLIRATGSEPARSIEGNWA